MKVRIIKIKSTIKKKKNTDFCSERLFINFIRNFIKFEVIIQ